MMLARHSLEWRRAWWARFTIRRGELVGTVGSTYWVRRNRHAEKDRGAVDSEVVVGSA